MADTGLTVWAPGFWADDFWAAGFWSSAAGGAVFPDPADVRSGITYGPTGADYTGTLISGSGSAFFRRR